jgi:hypothetical protein
MTVDLARHSSATHRPSRYTSQAPTRRRRLSTTDAQDEVQQPGALFLISIKLSLAGVRVVSTSVSLPSCEVTLQDGRHDLESEPCGMCFSPILYRSTSFPAVHRKVARKCLQKMVIRCHQVESHIDSPYKTIVALINISEAFQQDILDVEMCRIQHRPGKFSA